MADASRIDYSRPLPWYKSRRLHRRLIIAAGVVLSFSFLTLVIPPLFQSYLFLHHQRQCLEFSLSSTHVVYEEDPAAAAALLRSPGYLPIRVSWSTTPNACFQPAPWRRFLDRLDTLRPPAYYSFSRDSAVLFLHERSIAGQSRLVCVSYRPASSFSPGNSALSWDVWVPGNHNTPPKLQGMPLQGQGVHGTSRTTRRVRYYAGQPDPANPSRFTIDFEINGSRGTLVGELTPDAKSITITVPAGPLSRELTTQTWPL